MRIVTYLCAALLLSATGAVAADQNQRPNILFCIADDASWPHFGAYGCTWVNPGDFEKENLE